MKAPEQITITVSKHVAELIREAVASGAYESESAFIEARVRERYFDDVSDETLRREVLPVLEAMDADPTRGIPLEEARTRMAEHHSHHKRVA